MASIRPYTQQLVPSLDSGAGGRRATAEDFGAVDVSEFTNQITAAAKMYQRREEQAEVSELNAKMSKAQADWTTSPSRGWAG